MEMGTQSGKVVRPPVSFPSTKRPRGPNLLWVFRNLLGKEIPREPLLSNS